MKAWDKTKDWVSNNRVASGAIAGGAVGTTFWGVGIVPGVIIGAGVGYFSQKSANAKRQLEIAAKDPKVKNVKSVG